MEKQQYDPTTYTMSEENQKELDNHIKKMDTKLRDIRINLAEDRVKLPDQNYALISIVSPENTTQKHDKLCIKIKGVFGLLEDAKGYAKQLMDEDPLFDIYVVSLYEWLLLPPNTNSIKEQVYTDEDLNTMIYEYRKHQEISKKQFEIRKEDLKNNPDINKLINEENDMNIQRYIEQDKNIEENKEEIK